MIGFRQNIYRNVGLPCSRFASIRRLDTERCGVSLQGLLQSPLWRSLCFRGLNHVFLLTEEFLFRSTAMLTQALLYYHREWIFLARDKTPRQPSLFFLKVYFYSPTLTHEPMLVAKLLLGHNDFSVLIWAFKIQSKGMFLLSWFRFLR